MRFKDKLRKFKELNWKVRLLWRVGLRTYSWQYGFCEGWFWQPALKVVEAYHAKQLTRERQRVNEEKAELARVGAKFSEKLAKVGIERDVRSSYGSQAYRTIIEIPENMAHEVFQWGNDNKALEYFSEFVGHQVLRELKTMNFRRFNTRPYYEYKPLPFGADGIANPADVVVERKWGPNGEV